MQRLARVNAPLRRTGKITLSDPRVFPERSGTKHSQYCPGSPFHSSRMEAALMMGFQNSRVPIRVANSSGVLVGASHPFCFKGSRINGSFVAFVMERLIC